MHPFLKDIKRNLKLMEKLAKNRKAPVFFARKGFEDNPFWVLIFVVLSSRTKDEKTSEAVNNLIKKYGNEKTLAKADEEEVKKLIYGVGFYKTKASRIIKIAQYVSKKGVPSTFEELVKLKGVGRKTANVVLNILHKKAVIGVDTHVHRISNRLGLVKTKSPEQTEKELNKLIPEKYKSQLNETFVAFGQTVCKPKNPDCDSCPIKNLCNYKKSQEN